MLMNAVCVENVATLFYDADNAQRLRDHCLAFICEEFDRASKTSAFQERCYADVDLVIEVLKSR